MSGNSNKHPAAKKERQTPIKCIAGIWACQIAERKKPRGHQCYTGPSGQSPEHSFQVFRRAARPRLVSHWWASNEGDQVDGGAGRRLPGSLSFWVTRMVHPRSKRERPMYWAMPYGVALPRARRHAQTAQQAAGPGVGSPRAAAERGQGSPDGPRAGRSDCAGAKHAQRPPSPPNRGPRHSYLYVGSFAAALSAPSSISKHNPVPCGRLTCPSSLLVQFRRTILPHNSSSYDS